LSQLNASRCYYTRTDNFVLVNNYTCHIAQPEDQKSKRWYYVAVLCNNNSAISPFWKGRFWGWN